MDTLYFDCSMGAAGDMLAAALLELAAGDPINELNVLGIPNVIISAEKSVKCGITGTHFSVKINGEEEGHEHHHEHHHHNKMSDIENIIYGLSMSDKIKNDVFSVYKIIAEAESKVHGTTVSEVHFHEVGAMDAVADITAVSLLLHKLSPDIILASHVNTGHGTVKCAHGILPVPAPATAEILRGIPAYSDDIEGELCTPTGAALLKYFVCDFVSCKPSFISEKIGRGMGNKNFKRANCLTVFSGKTE